MTDSEAIAHLQLALRANETGAEHSAALAAYHGDELKAFVARCAEVEQRRAVLALSIALDAMRERLRKAKP